MTKKNCNFFFFFFFVKRTFKSSKPKQFHWVNNFGIKEESFSSLKPMLKKYLWRIDDKIDLIFSLVIVELFCHSDFTWKQSFRVSRVSKSAKLSHLDVLNFDFCEFLQFLKAVNCNCPNEQNSELLKWQKCSFATSRFSKIDFT